MRGEIQGQDECILGTLADLTKYPLARVREIALRAARTVCPSIQTWHDAFWVQQLTPGAEFGPYWKGVIAVCRELDPSGELYPAIRTVSRTMGVELAPSGSPIKYLDYRARVLPPIGRGVITLRRRDCSHIVPWEDGRAYDPNIVIPGGESLKEIRTRYGMDGFKIGRIAILKGTK